MKDLKKMKAEGKDVPMQLQRFSNSIAEAVMINKFDEHLNKEQFNESRRDVMMSAEIHDLFERDLIDLVSSDNTTNVEIIVADNGTRVLLVGNHCRYAMWRELYDTL